MPFSGYASFASYTRARSRMPLLAAFWMAFAFVALSYTRASAASNASVQAPAAPAKAEPASVAEARTRVIRREPGAKVRVQELLRAEADGAARARLVSVLGALPAKQLSAADFDAALGDADAQVRVAALTSLGKLGGAGVESRLTAALKSDPSAGARMNAAFWLGQAAHRGAAAALGQALATDKDANVRLAAAQALTRLNTSAARRELRRGAADADEGVRRWAK